MGKQIRFIKENDLFNWKVGDIVEVSLIDNIAWVPAIYKVDGRRNRNMVDAKYMVEKGYAEWVEEPKEKTLAEQVDDLVDRYIIGYYTDHIAEEELARRVYEYVVGKMNGGWKPNWEDPAEFKYHLCYNSELGWYTTFTKSNMSVGVKYIKSPEIRNALIASKKLRPYLDMLRNL